MALKRVKLLNAKHERQWGHLQADPNASAEAAEIQAPHPPCTWSTRGGWSDAVSARPPAFSAWPAITNACPKPWPTCTSGLCLPHPAPSEHCHALRSEHALGAAPSSLPHRCITRSRRCLPPRRTRPSPGARHTASKNPVVSHSRKCLCTALVLQNHSARSALHWQPVRSTSAIASKTTRAGLGLSPTAELADEGYPGVKLAPGRNQRLHQTPERIRHVPRLSYHAPGLNRNESRTIGC